MPHCPRAIPLCIVACLSIALTSPAARAQDAATLERGKNIFTTEAQPSCAVCHTLADAGATGEIGINLDDFKPTEQQVQAAVRDGVGVMPAYKQSLSEEQIEAVAQYVAKAVRK